MSIILIISCIVIAAYLALFLVYIFKLDMKLVKVFEPMMNKHYDNLVKDRKL